MSIHLFDLKGNQHLFLNCDLNKNQHNLYLQFWSLNQDLLPIPVIACSRDISVRRIANDNVSKKEKPSFQSGQTRLGCTAV